MQNPDEPRNGGPPRVPVCPDPLRWSGLAVLALYLLSLPWIAPGLSGRTVLGIPSVLAYLFGIWAGLILLGALQRPGR